SRECLLSLERFPMTTVGMVLFPKLTKLDLTGPYEVFCRMPATPVHLVAAIPGPVVSEHGLTFPPDTTFDGSPPFDLLFAPGVNGMNDRLAGRESLPFLRKLAAQDKFITAVCTCALLLGPAGLLHGYRATTHWLSLDLLPLLGAAPVAERVVVDRNRITGG